MKRTCPAPTGFWFVLVCCLMLGVTGCEREAAGELAALSGAYLGDMVTLVVTDCLYGALGVEGGASLDEHAHEDEHSHDTEPLHDHEH